MLSDTIEPLVCRVCGNAIVLYVRALHEGSLNVDVNNGEKSRREIGYEGLFLSFRANSFKYS